MRPELKFKLLQYFNKEKVDQGFTLIELLVVIVIIGILAAVALPNFLSQSAKAKQSEAKQYIAAINRTQQTYRTNNNTFADSFDKLALGSVKGGTSATTTSYNYSLVDYTADSTTALATSRNTSLKSYSAAITRYNNAENLPIVTSSICEAIVNGTDPASLPIITTGPSASMTCDTSSTIQLGI